MSISFQAITAVSYQVTKLRKLADISFLSSANPTYLSESVTDPYWGEDLAYQEPMPGEGWLLKSSENAQKWLAVILDQGYFVQRAAYLGRTDVGGQRLGGMTVYVGDKGGTDQKFCGKIEAMLIHF